MFRRIVFAAAASGLIAGLLASAVQSVKAIPLIHLAETYEKKEPAPPKARADALAQAERGDAQKQEDDGFSRMALTVVSNVVTAIGFALLIIAGFAIRGGVDWKEGIVWGIGGFTAFGLAPAIGLPPELPGTFAAALPGRQIWWVATAVATSAGLLLLAFKSGIPWKAAGVALIVLPHLIGAPQPEKHGGLAPHELMRSFVVATLMTSAIFWVVLGAAAAFFFHRQGDVEKTA